MHANHTVIGLSGALIVAFLCFDIFHTIIVPRLALRHVRISRLLIAYILWPSYRRLVAVLPESWRTGFLEVFAPLAFVSLLVTWLCGLIAGFALVIFSLGSYTRPPISSLAEAAYFAGTSVLTLGFGDVVAAEWPARAVVLIAAVLGLIFMALVVSMLFSMLSYLQQREQVVNTLMSRAGLPPSGVVLLMRYRELKIVNTLGATFVNWESWLASILESHRALPLLLYFRSTSPDNSWLATLGATLDAASLLLTSVDNEWVGEADLYYWMGVSMLKSMAENFNVRPVPQHGLTQEEYHQALQLLAAAGYEVRNSDTIWPYFSSRRSAYMQYIIPLADRFDIPTHDWLPEFKMYSVPAQVN